MASSRFRNFSLKGILTNPVFWLVVAGAVAVVAFYLRTPPKSPWIEMPLHQQEMTNLDPSSDLSNPSCKKNIACISSGDYDNKCNTDYDYSWNLAKEFLQRNCSIMSQFNTNQGVGGPCEVGHCPDINPPPATSVKVYTGNVGPDICFRINFYRNNGERYRYTECLFNESVLNFKPGPSTNSQSLFSNNDIVVIEVLKSQNGTKIRLAYYACLISDWMIKFPPNSTQ